MAEPFLSEIRIFSFNFAPKGWAMCNGQLLPINQNQALFSLLGTMYGGNGQINFALPDLRGRCTTHTGSGHTLGEKAGSESVTLSQSQMPQHVHLQKASDAGAAAIIPTGNVLGAFANGYTAASSLIAINAGTVSSLGGSQPHENMTPFLALNFCIALQGIFPSPN